VNLKVLFEVLSTLQVDLKLLDKRNSSLNPSLITLDRIIKDEQKFNPLICQNQKKTNKNENQHQNKLLKDRFQGKNLLLQFHFQRNFLLELQAQLKCLHHLNRKLKNIQSFEFITRIRNVQR